MWDDDSVAMYGDRLKQHSLIVKCKSANVYIHPKLLARMQYWIDLASGEVGGLGKIRKLESGDTNAVFVIETVDLLPQVASPMRVQLDSIAEMAWMDLNYPGWKESMAKPSVFFWHSHVDMASRFSSQDDIAIRSLTAMGGLIVSVVGNKRKEFDTRLDFEIPVTGIPVTIEATLHEQSLQWLTAKEQALMELEFDEKVEENKELYGIDKEIADLAVSAKGADRIAEIAQAKIEKLRKEKKKFGNMGKVIKAVARPLGVWNPKTMSYEYDEPDDPTHDDPTRAGAVSQADGDQPPRTCRDCEGEIDSWDPPNTKLCWECRKPKVAN